MTAFAYWDATPEAPPRQAELVGLWHRATLAAGQIPRLLTARDVPKAKRDASPADLPLLALRAKKGRALIDLRIYESRL